MFAGIVLLTVLFQSAGKVGSSFVLSISRQSVAFVAALLVCVKFFAYNGVLIGQVVADVVSALITPSLLVLCNPMGQEEKSLKTSSQTDYAAHQGTNSLYCRAGPERLRDGP